MPRRLGRLRRDHPRLCLDEAAAARLAATAGEEGLLGSLVRAMVGGAETMLQAPLVEHRLVGGYPTLLDVSRQCLRLVSHLSFAFLVSHDDRFLRRAERQMLAACAFPDWNPTHFLSAAEMTAALAIGYDWLYADLSADSRDKIRDALIEKGLQPSFTYATEGPRVIADGTWPICDDNNWTQVCHAGVVLAALAIGDEEPNLAEAVVDRAVMRLPGTMQAIYGSSGSYGEGPMYWSYGTTFNALIIDALRSALGDAFGLDAFPGFRGTADYHLHMTGPTGLYFNYSDCRESTTLEPAMFWFARELGRPDLLWHEVAKLRTCAEDPQHEACHRWLRHRLLPLLPIWAPSLGRVEPPATRHWLAEGSNPVAVHRSGWDREATFVGIKAGSPAHDHGHMDAGSFVLDAQGVRWALDLGLQEYATLGPGIWERHQESERWQVFRMSNHSHNTLVVDGALQRVEGCAPVTSFEGDGEPAHTEVDLSTVYAGQLAGVRRRATLCADGAVLIEDWLRGGSATSIVRWGMVTRSDVELAGEHQAVLRQEGKSLRLHVTSPAGAVLHIVETASPKTAWDAPNAGTFMVAFDVEVPAGGELTLRVLLTADHG